MQMLLVKNVLLPQSPVPKSKVEIDVDDGRVCKSSAST